MSPPRDLDELASALIDGLLDGDDAAAAQRDPAVLRRVEQMRAARDAVRDVAPPADAARDAAIAAALRAADGVLPAAGGALPYDPGAGVVPMDPARDPFAERRAGPADVPATPASPERPYEATSVGADPMGPAGLDNAPPATGAPGAGGAPSPSVEPVDPNRAWGAPGEAPGGSGDARVVPMGAARSGRSGRPARRWSDPRWLGAAAAVVLVLAVGGLLAVSGGSDSDDEQTAAMDSSSDEPTTSAGGQAESESAPGAGEDGSGGAGSASEEGGSGSPAAPDEMSPNSDASASGAGRVVDLGDADDRGELVDRVGAALDDSGARTQAPSAADDGDDTGGSASRPPAAAVGDCEDPLAGRSAGPLVMTGRGTIEGESVAVWVHEDGGAHRMVAVDRSCAVVAEGVVPG